MRQRSGLCRMVILGVGAAVLGGCVTTPPVLKTPPAAEPATATPAGPAPDVLRAALAARPLPALASAADVPAFVSAAAVAPVAQREAVRGLIAGARDNAAIASRLIAEFELARSRDFSRAQVALALLGEQRNTAGLAFLTTFVWQPLPGGGLAIEELGMSVAAEAQERLQVQAANAIPYARTQPALQAALEIAARHPSKAVRIEAASSYLWNRGNSEEARRTLGQVLRRDELVVLDRPIREAGMTGQDFNRQLARYLERHPELQPPPPERSGHGNPQPTGEDAALPPPPAESKSSGQENLR